MLRNNLKFSTGLLNNQIEISGSLSKLNSEGYVDRSWVDMDSYFLQASYKDGNTLIKAVLFGGDQVTYQAWYRIDRQILIERGRTFKVARFYSNDNGIAKF